MQIKPGLVPAARPPKRRFLPHDVVCEGQLRLLVDVEVVHTRTLARRDSAFFAPSYISAEG